MNNYEQNDIIDQHNMISINSNGEMTSTSIKAWFVRFYRSFL